MKPIDYAETLRRKLAAASLPAHSKRVEALLGALISSPPEEVDQVAGLVSSVVATLTNPVRRKGMWKKMENMSSAQWQDMARRKADQSTTRAKRPGSRPLSPSDKQVRAIEDEQVEQLETVLLGVVGQALQGGGHFQLEVERAIQEGLFTEDSPCYSILKKLRAALRTAERKHRHAVGPLSHLAAEVLAVFTEHPERTEEMLTAGRGLLPGQWRVFALGQAKLRSAEAKRIEDVVGRLGLEINTPEDMGALSEKLTELEAVGWGDAERQLATSIQVHLRQGQELLDRAEANGEDPERRQRNARRHQRARERASDLVALLLATRKRSPIWWERVVQAELREIEIDSLGAKRIRASRQKALAAKALKAVGMHDATSTERNIECEIAAELGRGLGQLEYELSQRPNDVELKQQIGQAVLSLNEFLSGKGNALREKLSEIVDGAREMAAQGGLTTESGEWLFDME